MMVGRGEARKGVFIAFAEQLMHLWMTRVVVQRVAEVGDPVHVDVGRYTIAVFEGKQVNLGSCTDKGRLFGLAGHDQTVLSYHLSFRGVGGEQITGESITGPLALEIWGLDVGLEYSAVRRRGTQ